MNVRLRGIYTTALTELLREERAIVQASPPIRERFDEEFATEPADVEIFTTDDRQGVSVAGESAAVERLRTRLDRVARDTLSWDDPAPSGAVFQGIVTETLGSGAVVDLGDCGGFLPYDRTDDYVDEGDRLRVQVARPEPPWSDARPSLATDLRTPGGLVELRRSGGSIGGETARIADLLPVSPPDGWAPRWSRAADDADLDAMATALERERDRAELMMAAIADADPDNVPGLLVAPIDGVWLWFGRESRFALDDIRREVTTTMAGHHRIKAGTESASAAVDFVEAICDPGDEFPFDVVTRQFGPLVGDTVAIGHGKPDGRLIVLGRGEVTDRDPDGTVTVERRMTAGGSYDALGVSRVAGDVATTTFVEGRWWYPTVYRGEDGTRRGTYVNVCTPVEIFPDAVRYVDLHVDVVKGPDGTVRRVDDDDLDAAVDAGEVSESLAECARAVAASIENAL